MNRLGQHFLKSKKIIEEIIQAAELTKNDVVLEVGPGKGTLTEALLETGAKIIAVEKDKCLVRYLMDRFSAAGNLEIIAGDILKIKNSDLFKNKNYKIVANIPYYITSRFLRQFLSAEHQPKLMVLMLQKEVARRICAKPPQMSLLAVSVQVYGTPKIIASVPKRYFSPAPKVDSAVLKISNISKSFFASTATTVVAAEANEAAFFDLVKKGFSHKRKLLKNNLNLTRFSLVKCGVTEKIRAQELSLQDWLCFCRISDVC